MKTIHDEDKITAEILKILAYQQVITNQGTNYQGEKDWALNKIKGLLTEVRLKTIDEAIGCVPKEDGSDWHDAIITWNVGREQTITKLKQLKK